MEKSCTLIHATLIRYNTMPDEYYETKRPIKCLSCSNWFETSLQYCKQEEVKIHDKMETIYTVYCPYCCQEHRFKTAEPLVWA